MQISVSSQTTLLNINNYFVFALYDATAPTVLLESVQPAKPYGNPLQISFTHNCLNGHIYIIKLWESADSTPTGVVRNSFSQSVNSNSVAVRMPIYLEVGLDAGFTPGATTYVDTSWAGWNYWVVRNPNTMIPDFTTNSNPDYHQEASGGFTLIQEGDNFQDGEKFEIHFIPQVVATAIGTPSSLFSTGRAITSDETLTIADIGQALLIQSETDKITVTLPAISSIADFSFLYFYSSGGSHINAVIQAPGTDKIVYPTDLSQIILGQCEVLKIFKAFGKWNIENDLPGVKMVGELVYDYASLINTLPLSGQLISRATYPRLWAWVQRLGAGSVVSDYAWNSTFIPIDGINYYTNKGFFSTGDGSTTFRLPLIDRYFLRSGDINLRVPGSLELQSIQAHDHTITASNQSNFGGWGYVPGVNLAGYESGGKTDKTGSQETKPTNIGVPLLIRI